MMATYKTKCGLYFQRYDGGASYYLGECWGKEYGKETCHCPYDKQLECDYGIDFYKKYKSLIGHCDGMLVNDEEYDYENSIEKIRDNFSTLSHKKVSEKFGGYCMAISADGKGGYKINREEGCYGCWNKVCNITGKERDLTKVRLMGDVETCWVEEIGFIKEEHKNLVRKKVMKDLIPLEYAERLLKTKTATWFDTFETNNCKNTSQMLGLAPPSKILRFYYEKSKAKRDLLEDLKAVQEGYNVIHEIDQEKETKRQKREKKLKKQEAKEIKIKKNKRLFKVQQMDLFKEKL